MSGRNQLKDKAGFGIALFEALPLPVMVVDANVRILYYNSAAAVLVGGTSEAVIRNRMGEVLHCVHSTEALEGCGYAPFCEDCIIRNSVSQSFNGRKVSRKLQRMNLLQKDKDVDIYLLVTTAPLQYLNEQLVMVLLEDVSELTALRRLIPICSKCKKIRDDQEYWQHLDVYFKQHLDMNFTHSLCPDCIAKLYPGFSD
jgi:nitrogen-specific signal transduction histidine kinase